MNLLLKGTKHSKLRAFVQFILVYGFIFNPWSTFPYTFIILIIFIVLLTYWNDSSLNNIGFKSNIGVQNTIGHGLILFVLVVPTMDFVVQPLTNKLTGEVTDYSTFESIAFNFSKYIQYLFFVIISASFGEEILFRGFLFRQFEIILPKCKFKTGFIVTISAVLFSLPHLYQGLSGLIMTFTFGLIFAMVYIKTNFNLWVNIILHGLIDIMFLTLAYCDKLDYYVLGNDLFFGY